MGRINPIKLDHLQRREKMERCSRCIIPKTAKSITLDEKGLCMLCRNYKKFIPKGEQHLRGEIKNYIKGSAKYNCVVPVSGGRDSSYALYYAKEVLGLSPLAVHNDNDFETEIAKRNLENITNSLDVPLVRVSSKKQISRKIVAEKFKMNVPFGPELVRDQICEPCTYGIKSASYNTARKEGIQLIIWGDSKNETTESYRTLLSRKIPTTWQRLFSSGAVNLFKYKYYFRKLRNEYGVNSPDGLKEIYLYDYIEWDRRIIIDTIRKKTGWSKGHGSVTSWRIDCALFPIVDYLTKKAYGVSKIEVGFSSMIRSGKMDRNDALRQVEEIENATDTNKLENLLKEINISASCISKVLP